MRMWCRVNGGAGKCGAGDGGGTAMRLIGRHGEEHGIKVQKSVKDERGGMRRYAIRVEEGEGEGFRVLAR